LWPRKLPPMLTVRARTEDLLVLGMSRKQELARLTLFLAGLTLIGLCFADDVRENVASAVMLVPLTALAGLPIFCHEQLILDRRAGLLVYRSQWRHRRTCRFEDVDHLELFVGWVVYPECKVALKDGSCFAIIRGRPESGRLARTVASFLRVPLERRYIA